MSYRSQYFEEDLAGFAVGSTDETGGIVLNSRKGRSEPTLCQGEDDVINLCGIPSSFYPEVFEAIAYSRSAPIYVSCVIGDNAKYGGVHVLKDSVIPFNTGSTDPTLKDYSAYLEENSPYTAGTGNGLVATFAGTLPHIPVEAGSFVLKVNGVVQDATESSGTITGADATGTLNLTTGDYSVTFTGVVGTAATITTDIDVSSPIDLSAGSVDKFVNLIIDGTLYENINLGQSATTSQTNLIDAINTAVGSTVAVASGNFIAITGFIGSTSGNITLDDPTTGTTGLDLAFSSTGTLTDTGTNPTLSIPKFGESVVIEYDYEDDYSALISHSIYATSQYTDDLKIMVKWNTGQQFTAVLYTVNENNLELELGTYNYSLIREKDGFGKSLYYEDVFRDNIYIDLIINSTFSDTYTVDSSKVSFAGGYRGDSPTAASKYVIGWDWFKKSKKYPCTNFIDANGQSAVTLNTLVNTYQPTAHGITVIPLGNDTTNAVTYRQSLGINSDNVSLYTNWAKIKDVYNDSAAWISNAGSVGRKYSLMVDVFDAASPAGIDENNHGGLLADWQVIEVEYDYSNSELQTLDEAQINPIIFDDIDGLKIYGDKTLLSNLTDTSYVGTRRMYNKIRKDVENQVMRLQEFRINDSAHRLKAKMLCESLIDPIVAGGWIREYEVVCDLRNNTDDVLNARQFVIDIYVKVTPNAQQVRLNFIRLAQNQVLSELIPG